MVFLTDSHKSLILNYLVNFLLVVLFILVWRHYWLVLFFVSLRGGNVNFRELFGTIVELFEQLPQISEDVISWFITYNPNTGMRPIEFFIGAGLSVYVVATVIKYVIDIIF